jgi:hypothetical protein
MQNTYDPLKQYLTSNNQAFSMSNLSNLAASKGIQGYTGTDAQNNQLAGMLNPTPTAPVAPQPSNATVVTNNGMNSTVNGIVTKSQQLGAIPNPQAATQTNTQTATTQPQNQNIDYATAPYQLDPTTGVKSYYNPNSGAYDQYETNGGVVNYGGISMPSSVLSDPYQKAMADNILRAQKSDDAALATQLKAIQDRFTQYRAQQQAVTDSGAAGVRNALLQSGAGGRGSVAQYAAATSDARVNSIISDGMQKIQELNNQEQEVVAAAQKAYSDGNYKRLEKLNEMIEKTRQEKLELSKESNKKVATEIAQAAKDKAIAEAYELAGNDPITILKSLDQAGYKDISAKNVTDTIELLTNQKGLDDIAKEIAKAGGDPSVIKGAKTVSEAIDMAAGSFVKTNNQIVKLGNSAYLIDKNTGKVTQSFGAPIPVPAGRSTAVGVSGGTGSASTSGGSYKSDLDALTGNVLNTIPTKFGQQTFKESLAKARDDADKISIIATVLLKNAPSEERKDFVNQTVGIKQLDKAISLLDGGVKTGVIEAGKQYTYNLAGKDYDPKLAQLNQLITSAIQPYRNSVTGAAWGDQEEAEYQQLFGSTKYSPAELKQRLQGVKEIMKDKSTGALRAYADPLSQYSDPFSNTFKLSKGNMDDRTYVDKTVRAQSIPYDQIVNNTPDGQIPVADNQTGEIGYIPIEEYNSTLYTKL